MTDEKITGMEEQDLEKSKIGIIGAGGWGLALSNILSINHNVCVWVYEKDEYENLSKEYESRTYLPEIKLRSDIAFTQNIENAVLGKDLIIMVTPSFAFESTAKEVSKYIGKETIIVIATKGLDTKTLTSLSKTAKKIMPKQSVLTFSGPSHAEEVARLTPTAIVIAGKEKDKLIKARSILMTKPFLRVYSSSDQKGVEISGALKNIYAIASGVVEGLGLGDNTKAALITRSLAEMVRFAKHAGGKEKTLYGLSGVGDLIVTCMSPLSRNFRFGKMLAQGKTYNEIKKETKQVAEGVYAAEAVYKYSVKHKIDMPIAESVYNVIYNGYDCKEMLHNLMSREAKNEYNDIINL